MPMDSLMPSIDSNDKWWFNVRRIGKQTKLSILPRRCFLSNKHIWFKKCVVITSMVTGPGDPIFRTFWCDPRQFFLYEISKGN
jgi:hypothetical protein